MGRIRLQVRVPPVQDSTSTSASAQARQNNANITPIKVVVSCDEDATLQDLNDKVIARWADIYVGYGILKIKHFETYFGEVLAMYDRVGEYFDDRSTDDPSKDDGVPKTSIALLRRHPPEPAELQNVRRFGSLMPESAAIPRKRPLTIAQQIHPNGFEGWDPEQPNGVRKRRKTQQACHNEDLNIHRDEPMISREEVVGVCRSSQKSGTQGSVHQVIDSQKSPRMNNSNPYGTPTSLSLISPDDHVLGDGRIISMIPDSPTSRGPRSISEDFGTTIDVHRESTKSESPELDPPIHDMALTNSSSPAGEQVDRGVYEVEPEIPPDVSSTIVQTDRQSHPASSLTVLVDAGATPNSTLIQHSMDASSVVDNEKRRHQTEHVGNTQTPFKRKTPSKDITPGEQAINGINGDIYDPIESDSESFQEKQRMHSAKRLKNSNTNRGHFVAPCVPPSRGKERKDDGFVVPSLPASRDHRARLPLLTNANPGGDGTNIQDNGQVLEAHQRSSVTTAEGSQSSENVTITEKVAGQEDASAGRATAKIDDRSRTTSNPHGSSTQEAGRLAADDLAVGKKRRPAQPKLEEDELGNIRRTTDGSKEMKQAAEQKKMEEILARGRQTREKALAEEAKKIMLAADGARHLEAEKIEKKRMNGKPDKEVAAPTETSPKVLRIAETKSSEMLPSTSNKTISREMSVNDSASKRPLPIESTSHNIPGSNGAALTAHTVTRYKPRTEEQKARRIELAAQKKAAEARAAERRNSSDGMTMREQDMPILERCVQKFRALSDDTSGHSSTPSEPASICGQKRKTMTPALPKSSVNTPSSNKNGVLSSSPMSSKSLNGQETPLRSALKQGSSALRRSVSFVDDPEDHLPGSKASIFLSPPMTHHIDIGSRPVQTSTDIDNELSFKTPNKSNPLKPAMPWKGSGSKASETNSVKKGKLQTKLNVTRHVAKGKEREIDAPVVREHPPPQVKQKSSPSDDDSVSSFLSDEAVGPDGSSKAGPSSRMSRGRMEPLRKKAAAADALPDSLIDPEFHNITVGKDKALTPVPASTSLPEQKSKTRSPALPLPEQTSPDFGSTSNSEEGWHCDSDDTSGSSSEQSDSLSSADEVENQSSNQARVGIEGARKAVSVEIRSPSITSKSQPSQISSTPSSKSRNPPPNDGGTRLADQVAKEQLRSESHQSLPTPKAGNKATCEVSAQEKPASIPNQKLDRHGRLPNGIRPANYRYPSLSQLRRQSKAESVFGVPSTSQAPATTSVGEGAVASHSSEDESSEDESSNSEDDKAAKNGQPKLKSTSGRIPGLRGLIKLAKSVSGLAQ